MEIGQNRTNIQEPQEVNVQENLQYEALISFKALGGLITDEEGNTAKMSMEAFAQTIDVARSTLYEWMKRPGFWDLVNERRKEISPQSRLAKMHDVWFLSALKPGNDGYRDRVLWLANFDPNFRTPTQKHEIEAGDSLVEAIGLARARRQAIEAEVIDEPNTKA